MLADTRPLQNPHFRRLWTANIVTVVGAQLTVVAVPAQIYAITGSSADVGLTGLFGLLPLVVFGLWGGALADHFDRRSLLILTTIGLIATSALFWLQAALGNTDVWYLLGLFAVQQAFFAINQPTRSAVLPRLLDLDVLPAANSLNMTVMQAGAIGGPLLAGVLIPFTGYSWLYLARLCLPAGHALGGHPAPPLADRGRYRDARHSLGHRGHCVSPHSTSADDELRRRHHRDGLRHAPRPLPRNRAREFPRPNRRWPRLCLAVCGHPDRRSRRWHLLRLGVPGGRPGRAVLWSIVVWGLAMVGFGLAVIGADAMPGRATTWLAVAVAMLIVGGAADMASAAFRTSMLQSAAADGVRGRLQGIFIVVVAGGPRVADTAHGASAALVGTAAAAAGGGVLVVILTVVAALAVPSFVRYRIR